MAKLRKKIVNLNARDSKHIEPLVSAGFCLSVRDAVRKGLDVLEADIEGLLHREVVPVCNELDAHPEDSLSAEEVTAAIYEYHEARMRQEAERPPRP